MSNVQHTVLAERLNTKMSTPRVCNVCGHSEFTVIGYQWLPESVFEKFGWETTMTDSEHPGMAAASVVVCTRCGNGFFTPAEFEDNAD